MPVITVPNMGKPGPPICQLVDAYISRRPALSQDPPTRIETNFSFPRTSSTPAAWATWAPCSCEFCQVIYQVVRSRIMTFDTYLALEIWGSGISIFKDKTYPVCELFMNSTQQIGHIPVSRAISDYTGSEPSLEIAIGWLTDCLKNHRTLCHSQATRTLPSRVLDVGLSVDDDVRLIVTGNLEGHYACLSHRWGKGPQPLRSTRNPDTFSQYQQGIDWGELPRTFQDAITFTRRLSLRYLWIDSLCIIQDDVKDWQIQSAMMTEIYQGAQITLAASAAYGPNYGLFSHVPKECLDSDVWNPFFSDQPQNFPSVRFRKPLPHRPQDHPLLSRAWVFQERALSPRTLHFGTHELIWECLECTTCECKRLGNSWASRMKWLSAKHTLNAWTLMSIHKQEDYTLLAQIWRRAVQDYSNMKLTHANDIFPAISGVAKRFSRATGARYVAGLWKDWLAEDLIWTVASNKTAKRTTLWRAPTFSWASKISVAIYPIRTFVEWKFSERINEDERDPWTTTIHVDVIRTSAVSKGFDDFGELISAHIVLRGTLVEGLLTSSTSTLSGQRSWHIQTSTETVLRCNTLFFPDYDFDILRLQLENIAVFCLKICTLNRTILPSQGSCSVFLVLNKVGEVDEGGEAGRCGVYERIGLLQDDGVLENPIEKVSSKDMVMENTVVKII